MSGTTTIPLSDLPGGEAASQQDNSLKTQTKLLKSTIVVTNNGEEFEFVIPTVRHEIRISSMIPRIRRIADPESAGDSMDGLDPSGYFYIRAIATFITCLKNTSATWVHSPGPDGKPILSWDSWPPDVTERVLEIALAFQEEVSRFHGRGTSTEQSAGQ